MTTSRSLTSWFALSALIAMLPLTALRAQAPVGFRYFYDDANELYRVLDSTGTLIEYDYDPSGNIINVSRTTLPAAQLSIVNVTPSTSPATGTKLTIFGQNFSPTVAGNTVTVGGITATIISATPTQLVVLIPPGTAGGAISVTVGGVTTTWSNNLTVAEAPLITSINPATGAAGATVAVSVAGLDLFGATFALQSVDPIDSNPGAVITVLSNIGTSATLSVVLGATQGQFALVGTNANGASTITPGSLFLVGPVTNSVSFYASVLNAAFNPATNPPLPAGQNSASFSASVLNTSYNPVTNPPFPPGNNSATFYASVLNASFNPIANPPLPAGQNTTSYYASVLNTIYNPVTNPPFPPGNNSAAFYASVLNANFNPVTNPALPVGQNTASYYASVLNTFYNPITNPTLPAGQNTVSYYISVCNTASGCTATAPAMVSADASPTVLRLRSRSAPPQGPRPDSPLPVIGPLDSFTTVTAGQTIRLVARNVEAGSIVEFDVNQTVVATVSEAPYEILFTVPESLGELVFQVVVRTPGFADRISQITRMTVVPDVGAPVSGSVTLIPGQSNTVPNSGGVELSLAAGGLKAEFFHLAQPVIALPSLNGLQPVRAGYVTAINQPNPSWVFGEDPLGARLGTDYAVRFSGEVRAEATGQYRFWLAARNGAAIQIDGKLLADSGFVSGEPAEIPVTVSLAGGWHSIDVVYYLAVGNSSVRLDWQQPGGVRREVLGPEFLRTVLSGMSTVSAADGTFAFPQVPRRFDTVWIRAKQGGGFIEFPGVAPGAPPVSIAVPEAK
jgi:YD repeat-containing protein